MDVGKYGPQQIRTLRGGVAKGTKQSVPRSFKIQYTEYDLHLEESVLIFFKSLDFDFLELDNRLKVDIGRGFNFLLSIEKL
jgi:hypothetical protein